MKEKAKSRLLARAAVEMPDRVVLDSSVIAAVFFQEDDDSVRAQEIVEDADPITLDTTICDCRWQ